MAKYKVILSDDAVRLLGNCVLFLAQKDKDAAVALKDRLIASIRTLEEFPARYPYLNEPYLPANKYRKMFVDNWYLILYQIKERAVYIDYVLDCRQDYHWLLR